MRLPLVPAGLGAPGLDTEGNQVLVTRVARGLPQSRPDPGCRLPCCGGVSPGVRSQGSLQGR